MKTINNGVYPAMITPYTIDHEVDYEAAKQLIQWYAQRGCPGVFADCLSNEIFYLSLEEREKLARTVLEAAPEGMDVVVSGHVSDTMDEQLKELAVMASLGSKAVVLITNRLAKEDESDEVLLRNAQTILEAFPDVDFGLYEAPLPYKRELTPKTIKALAETNRFIFLKDTCCEIEKIKAKLDAICGTRLKLYNANTATLLDSLDYGAAGYCGVMANFHPQYYVELTNIHSTEPEKAKKLQNYLGFSSVVQYQMYPLNAKRYLQLSGLPIQTTFCRNRADDKLDETMLTELEQMFAYDTYAKSYWNE